MKNRFRFIKLENTYTFSLITKKRRMYVIQIDLDCFQELKSLWWYPKCDKKCLNGMYTMFGWLFVRFGYLNRECIK